MTPTPRTLLLLGAGLILALLPAVFHPGLWPLWIAFLLASAAVLVRDLLLLVPSSKVRVEVAAPAHLYVGREHAIDISAHAPAGVRGLRLRVELRGPAASRLEGFVALESEEAKTTLPIVARRRAPVSLLELWLEWEGPLGLIRRRVRRPLDIEMPVLPDLTLVQDTALRFASPAEMLAGMHVKERSGDGSEFDSVREFVHGMDHRAIHWKASARHRKLLVREFRAERDHQVVLAVDCGHLMAEPLGAIPRLDHAVNAGLLLAWFGLRFGDRVGLHGFAASPRVHIAPRSGVSSFARLQAATVELDYSEEETNFTLGLADLSVRLNQRALIVVLTDFADSITAELMVENLTRIARRHLVLFVTLRDASLDRVAEAEAKTVEDVGRAVVASELLREREVVMQRLRRRGVLTLDTPPEQLSSGLINRYLEVKRREMIA